MEIRDLAGCVITDTRKRVLLLHRNKGKFQEWELPGGKVKPEESKADAAARETLEELGVVMGGLVLLGTTKFTGSYGINWKYWWFGAHIIEGEPHIREPRNHDDMGYFDLVHETNGMRTSANVWDLSQAIKNGQVKL